jgi:hypothetical protein
VSGSSQPRREPGDLARLRRGRLGTWACVGIAFVFGYAFRVTALYKAWEEPLASKPTGVYRHDDGRPMLGRKLKGKSAREMRDLGLLVEHGGTDPATAGPQSSLRAPAPAAALDDRVPTHHQPLDRDRIGGRHRDAVAPPQRRDDALDGRLSDG